MSASHAHCSAIRSGYDVPTTWVPTADARTQRGAHTPHKTCLKGDSAVGHVHEPCGHDAQRNKPVAERQTWPASTYVSKTVELTAQRGVWLPEPAGDTHQQAKLQQARGANSRALPYAAMPVVRRNVLST